MSLDIENKYWKIITIGCLVLLLISFAFVLPYELVILLLTFNVWFALLFELLTYLFNNLTLFLIMFALIKPTKFIQTIKSKYLYISIMGCSFLFSFVYAIAIFIGTLESTHHIFKALFNNYVLGFFIQALSYCSATFYILNLYKPNRYLRIRNIN